MASFEEIEKALTSLHVPRALLFHACTADCPTLALLARLRELELEFADLRSVRV